jgi:acetyl esterase/lipase
MYKHHIRGLKTAVCSILRVLIFICYFNIIFPPVHAQSLAGITNTPDTSYSLYSAFTGTKKTNPEIKIVGEIHSVAVKEKKNITYCSIGNRKLLLDAFYPSVKNKKTSPAIIIIHGGGWRSGNRTMHYPLAQKLAELGYVCFTPEYRLSTEALFPAAIYDIKAAIRWVRKNANEYNIDTTKIVVAGFSAGGEMAAFMGVTGNIPLFEGINCNTKEATSINAVIDIDGTLSFVHPETGEGDDSKRISAGTYWFGFSKKDNPEVWRIASPLTWAGKNTPATLFLNSSVDRMHAGRNDYIKILNEYNIYSEVHTFEGAPHSFCLFQPWFDPMVKYIDDFLKKVFNK